MEYLILLATILTGIYAYTYANWLKQNGNKAGAWGIYFIIIIGLAVGFYRVMT